MDEVEEIKHRLDIVEFISQYITLQKAGANYKAPCPFHNERTPSFMVSADKQIYKCFGCGEGGDIFQFLMKMEALEFPEALEILAQRAGITLQKRKNNQQYVQEKNIKNRLYKINDLSSRVYHKILLESREAQMARDYLVRRKISPQTIKEFSLGYASQKPILEGFLRKKGFSSQEIAQAGSPQRFFRRIVFPISDVMGNVLGFTARVIDNNDQPKYLNTSETTIFHKSRTLYALNLAKQAIKKANCAIVVEGQMDVILSYQAGVKNVVASSGTAFTHDHLEILGRYSPNIVFAFDADQAGQLAAKKALSMAIIQGLSCKMIIFPAGFKDVGEIVAKEPKKWLELVKSPYEALEWLFNQAFTNGKKLNGEEKKNIAQDLLPFIRIIPDKIEQAHWIKIVAQKLDVPVATIYDALSRVRISREKVANLSEKKGIASVEDYLIGLLLTSPQYLNLVMTELDYGDFTKDEVSQEIYKFLQGCYTKGKCLEGKDNCQNRQEILKCIEIKKSSQVAEKAKFLIFEVENRHKNSSEEIIKQDILEAASRIKGVKRDNIKKDFALAIKQAEDQGDRKQVKKLIQDFQYAISKK